LTAELDPKAKRKRLDLKTHATHEKALGHGSGAALQKRYLLALDWRAPEAKKATN
jgi:hypothetical protein